MFTYKYRHLICFLLVLAIGQRGQVEADDRLSSSLETVIVKKCAVNFVLNSTYATSRPGIIEDLPYEEGDLVPEGALVVQLRDEVARANLRLRERQAEMRSPIEVAEKERDAAKLELDYKIEARRESSNSFVGSDIERARIIYEARELQVKQAEDEFGLSAFAKAQAQAELESYAVHAKFGGLVTRVHKHIGEAVNLGDEIITIIDTSRVRVEGRLPYEQARRLQVGDPVRIQLDFSAINGRNRRTEFRSALSDSDERPKRVPLPEEQEVFAGRIGFIGVETGEKTGILDDLRVWAEVENRDNILLEGLPAKMTVQVRSRVTSR